MTESTQERFIKVREVQQITGLSRSGIYKAMGNGSFPAQFKIEAGGFAARWSLNEINAWMAVVKDNR